MKIKINTDDLVSRVSVHIAAWFGVFFFFVSMDLIKVMLGINNVYNGGGYIIIAPFLAIVLFLPLFAVFCIESLFKLRVKFKFLKNKFIKYTTLTFFTIYLILSIASFLFFFIGLGLALSFR